MMKENENIVEVTESSESSSSVIPMEIEQGVASFPAIEEIKSTVNGSTAHFHNNNNNNNNKNADNSRYCSRRWNFIYVGVLLIAIVIIVIPSIVWKSNTNNNDDDTSSSSSSVDVAAAPDFDGVVQYLVNNKVSSETNLRNVQTPQNRAVRWLVEEDVAQLPIPIEDDITNENGYGYNYIFRYVMTLLYFATGGDNDKEHGWEFNPNFLSANNVCDWNNLYANRGVVCDSLNQVPRSLLLYSLNIKGELPTELGMLTSLWSFWMYENPINGTIPNELCNIKTLHTLRIHTTNITGYIPSCIGQKTTVTIDLHDNNLIGTIPESICNSNVLWAIHLSDNQLTGSIPYCIGQQESNGNFEIVYLSNNKLSGSIPSSLGGITSLTHFFIDNNNFSGNPIPIFNKWINIESLMVDHNIFNGIIDDTFLINNQALNYSDFSNNQFTSTDGIPAHIFSLEQLDYIDLSYNQLGGMLPEIPQGSPIKRLFLAHNRLSGPIPASIKNLQNLGHLDLSNNTFTSTMPTEIGELTMLEYLFLSENPLFDAGPLPESYGNLTNLRELSVRNTNRQFTIPSYIGGNEQMNRLDLLDLSNNSFTGPLTTTNLGDLSMINYLLINNNPGLTGEIPNSFSNMIGLQSAFFDGTNLTGTMEVICDLPNFSSSNKDRSDVVLFADCDGDNAEIECTCECTCCDGGGHNTNGCSKPALNNLDANWENNFKRNWKDFYFSNDKEITDLITNGEPSSSNN